MPKVSDAHRLARRRQILDSAIACFARDGFHRTSMQHIIAEARLSPGAIYRYFPSKEDIIEAIADERHAQESALLAHALDARDIREALHRVTHAYFAWLKDPAEQRRRRVTVQVWAEALRNKRIAAIVQRGTAQRHPAVALFRAAQQRGVLDPRIDADALSRLMLAVIQGFILQQAWEPDLDIDSYVAVLDVLIDATFTDRQKRGRPARRI
jgi:AcrR family transcriptional regulator